MSFFFDELIVVVGIMWRGKNLGILLFLFKEVRMYRGERVRVGVFFLGIIGVNIWMNIIFWWKWNKSVCLFGKKGFKNRKRDCVKGGKEGWRKWSLYRGRI